MTTHAFTCAYCTGDKDGARPKWPYRDAFDQHMRTVHRGLSYEPPILTARLADLEALREVTEQLVVAADPYRRQFLAEKAETILRRLREPERVAS